MAIHGERYEERKEGDEHQGFRRSGRRYGSFYRSMALPESAGAEQAQASLPFNTQWPKRYVILRCRVFMCDHSLQRLRLLACTGTKTRYDLNSRRRLIPNGTRGRAFDRRDPAALPRQGRAGFGADPEPPAARSAAGRAPPLCDAEEALRARARRARAPGRNAALRAAAVEVRRARHRGRRRSGHGSACRTGGGRGGDVSARDATSRA